MNCLKMWWHSKDLRKSLVLLATSVTFWGCAELKAPNLEQERQALALIDQGTWYLRQAELEQAKASFEIANQIALTPQGLDGLGSVAMLEGNASVAERQFVEAYSMDPSYSEALANLALLYEQQGLWPEAQRLYEITVKANPANFRARNNQAAFQFEQGERQQGIRKRLLLAKALVDHPIIQNNLSALVEQEGDNGQSS